MAASSKQSGKKQRDYSGTDLEVETARDRTVRLCTAEVDSV